jgi:hypothetical protein
MLRMKISSAYDDPRRAHGERSERRGNASCILEAVHDLRTSKMQLPCEANDFVADVGRRPIQAVSEGIESVGSAHIDQVTYRTFQRHCISDRQLFQTVDFIEKKLQFGPLFTPQHQEQYPAVSGDKLSREIDDLALSPTGQQRFANDGERKLLPIMCARRRRKQDRERNRCT